MTTEDKKIIICTPIVLIVWFSFLYWLSTISQWAVGTALVIVFMLAMFMGMAHGDDSVE
jgi:hypothetical protein